MPYSYLFSLVSILFADHLCLTVELIHYWNLYDLVWCWKKVNPLVRRKTGLLCLTIP